MGQPKKKYRVGRFISTSGKVLDYACWPKQKSRFLLMFLPNLWCCTIGRCEKLSGLVAGSYAKQQRPANERLVFGIARFSIHSFQRNISASFCTYWYIET